MDDGLHIQRAERLDQPQQDCHPSILTMVVVPVSLLSELAKLLTESHYLLINIATFHVANSLAMICDLPYVYSNQL